MSTTANHYSRALDAQTILQRVNQHYPDGPDLYQLAPIDQLHTGGIKASEKLIAHISAGQRVLDIGAGVGGLMRLVMARKACTIVGLDITHAFNHLNRQLGRSKNPPQQMTTVTADGQQLPFADQTFDSVLCQHSLVNVPDKRTALSHIHRVLKPGGKLILHEIMREQHWPALHYPLPWARTADQSHLLSPQHLEVLLQEAQFKTVEMDDWTNEAMQWRQRQSQKEAQQHTRPPLSPALILGTDFEEMGKNIMKGLESGAIQVIECIAQR